MSGAAGCAAPLVAVDQIVEISETTIRTIKAIAGNEAFFLGHYPHFPIFPGVFVVEAVHQAACVFVSEGLKLPHHPRLRRMESVRFMSPLRPGDVLQVDATCSYERDSDGLLVTAHCARRETPPVPVAQVKLRYVLER